MRGSFTKISFCNCCCYCFRDLIDILPKDCLLVVLGDHGMTRTGDHGGDSFEEVDAALFMFSHSTITSTQKPNDVRLTCNNVMFKEFSRYSTRSQCCRCHKFARFVKSI